MIDRTYREKGYKMHNEKAESRERGGMGWGGGGATEQIGDWKGY